MDAGTLFAELKKRRVVRAVVGYGIGAFAVLQIVEPIMHGLHWPDSVLSYVIAGLAIGFPIVVSLAWIFDVNAGRIERAPRTAAIGRGHLALVLVGIGVLAAAPGLLWHFVFRGPTSFASPRGSSIVVLPFANLSADKESDYFSDGITEELINGLANVEGLRVVARTSAFSFKGKNVNVREVGEQLNVAAVLEGSVRREGSQVRVVAQLINAADGYHLWSHTYDREVKSIFSLEDELARAIVEALTPRLVKGPALVQPSTASVEAHDLYLRGRYFLNQRSKDALTKAASMFEQAMARDPNYALAHSGLADSYALMVQYGIARAADLLPKAREHARKAVQLDDSLAEAHTSLAYQLVIDFDWSGADRELRRAIELRPGYATAHFRYSLELVSVGRLDDALAEAQVALLLDPTSVPINNAFAGALFMRREYERVIAQEIKTLELDPRASFVRDWLAASYWQLGRVDDALRVFDSDPDQNAVRASRAWAVAMTGDVATARRMIADIESRFAEQPVSRAILAGAFFAVGDKDKGFLWLERAVEERDSGIFHLKVFPLWDSIRSERRYHQLLKRMNLE